MNSAPMEGKVRRVKSVCNVHGVAFGSATELPVFLKALEENKHLAMDFWATVSRMSDEEGTRAGGHASPSQALNARTLEVIVSGVTNCSVAEVIVTGGEPSRALAKLASLLAGEDLHQVGADQIGKGPAWVEEDELWWNGSGGAGVSVSEAAGVVGGGEAGPDVFATAEGVEGVEAARGSEVRESASEPVADLRAAEDPASWSGAFFGPGAEAESGGGMREPIWAQEEPLVEPSAESLLRAGENSRLVLEPETAKDFLPEPASRLRQPKTQRLPVGAQPIVRQPISPVEPIRPQRPVDRVNAVRSTEPIPSDRLNLPAGGADVVRSMEPGRTYRPNRRFEEENASRPMQPVGANGTADAAEPIRHPYPADPIVQMRAPHLFEDFGERERGAGRMMLWLLLLMVAGGVLTLVAKNQGWGGRKGAGESIRSAVRQATEAANQSASRGGYGAATNAVQSPEPSDVSGSEPSTAGSVMAQDTDRGTSHWSSGLQSGLQGGAEATPEGNGTNDGLKARGVHSQDGAGVKESAAAGAPTAASQTPAPVPESRSAALRAADDGKSVTSLSGDVALPALTLSGRGVQNIPVKVPGAVMENYLILSRVPPYPEGARPNGVEGRVVMQATILKSGEVGHLHVTEGDTALRGPALSAVSKWRYRPYMVKGEPAEVVTTITVDFKIAQ